MRLTCCCLPFSRAARYYVELAGAPGEPRAAVQAGVDAMAQCIIDEMLQPEANGLDMPPPLTE